MLLKRIIFNCLLFVKKASKKVFVIIRRAVNKRARFIYSDCVTGFKKDGKLILEDLDSNHTYFDPYIFKENSKKYLIISDRDDNAIIKGELCNNVMRNSVVLLRGKPNSWDEIVNRGCLIKYKNNYLLYYTGQKDGNSKIGLAISEDGIIFTRAENYIIAPERFEGNSVMNPFVIFDEKKQLFKMWYSSGETYEPDYICYAESLDGFVWKKYTNNPVFEKGEEKYDMYKVGGCDVIKIAGKYYMFYIGYQNLDTARVCLATSDDGIVWTRSKLNPIIGPTKNSWDSDSVYKPAVLLDDTDIKIFYNGRTGDLEQVGSVSGHKEELFL